ncbi:MAG: glycosyltransferase family 4 protein, partial [Candidatus Yanofskybacteria bacterium]|nr:glycosyltransferase family 4 protein [Candidatus Yanofskybacteria bacterium]
MNKCILIATGIFPPDFGGPASYASTLARHFSGQMPVTVVTYSQKISYKDDIGQKFKVIRVWKKIPWLLRHGVFFIRTYFAAGKSDAIYALNAVSTGVPAAIAAKLRNKEFFIKIVGDYSWEMAIQRGATVFMVNDYQKMKRTGWPGLLHKLQVWTCLQANGVIVPSKYLGGIVKGWGIPEDKIHVVYNGSQFEPSGLAKEDARKQVGIPGNIILSSGRLVPWKGFRMLIKIMPQLLNHNQFFRLIVVGDGPDMKVLQSMVKNLGLERKVYLVGKKSQAELATYLNAADLFVLNSGYEGFSHQLLEAMSSGVPVITS